MKGFELIQPLNKKDVNNLVVTPVSTSIRSFTIRTKFNAYVRVRDIKEKTSIKPSCVLNLRLLKNMCQNMTLDYIVLLMNNLVSLVLLPWQLTHLHYDATPSTMLHRH